MAALTARLRRGSSTGETLPQVMVCCQCRSVLPAPPSYAGTRQTPLEARRQVDCNRLRNATKMEENANIECCALQVEVNMEGLLIELLPGVHERPNT
jgi:hypothetical protein